MFDEEEAKIVVSEVRKTTQNTEVLKYGRKEE